MKRNIKFINIIFFTITFGLLFASCSMAGAQKESSVSFKLDSETVQKIRNAAGQTAKPNARAADDDNLFVEVAVHGGYEDSDIVPLLEEAIVSIDKIPIGSEIYVEATAFKKTGEDRQDLYKGQSKTFKVLNSDNFVMFIMHKVTSSESSAGGNSGGGTNNDGNSGGSGTWSAQLTDFTGNPLSSSIISPDSTANVYIKLTNSASGFNYSAVSDDINCIYDAYSGKKFQGMNMGGGLATKTVSADGILFCFSNNGSEWGEDIWEASVIKGPSQSYETIASCIFTGSANSNGIVVYGNLMTSNSNPVNLAVANYAQTIDVSKLKITCAKSDGTETEIPQSAINSERSEEDHFYYYVLTATYSPEESNIKVYYNNVLIKSLPVNRLYTG